MSLSDLNAIPLHDELKAEETSPLKVAGENGAEMARPSSPDLKVIPGYQLDVPELNTDEDEEAMKAYEAAGGAAALMIEAFYGNITSDKIPQWIRDAVEAQANRLQQTPDGDFSKGMGGSLGRKSKKEEAEENQEKTAEWFENRMEAYEREQKKLEEWREKSIDVGNGVKMTGKEIDAVLELLGTKEGKQKFVDAFKKKTGANDEDANKAFNDYQRYMQLLKKREMGEDLSAGDQKFLNDYPTTEEGKVALKLKDEVIQKNNMYEQAANTANQTAAIKDYNDNNSFYNTNITRPIATSTCEWSEKGSTNTSKETKLEPAIKCSTSATADFQAATTATEPLDTPKEDLSEKQNLQLASATVNNSYSAFS